MRANTSSTIASSSASTRSRSGLAGDARRPRRYASAKWPARAASCIRASTTGSGSAFADTVARAAGAVAAATGPATRPATRNSGIARRRVFIGTPSGEARERAVRASAAQHRFQGLADDVLGTVAGRALLQHALDLGRLVAELLQC